MKKFRKLTIGISIFCLVAVTLMTAALAAGGKGKKTKPPEPVPDSYVVIANSASGLSSEVTTTIADCGGTVTAPIPSIGVAIAESFDPNFAACAAVATDIRSVTLDVAVQLIEDPSYSTVYSYSLEEEAVVNPPNADDDRFFYLQWALDAIDAPEAWDLGYRGAGVRIAVLDSGIDSTHPDIAPNLNMALSTSFVPGEGVDVRPGFYFNHGTHVAGIIAAADNGEGTIGVAPEAEIVAVKVLSEYTTYGEFAGMMQGIVYATDIDADIINMSLGARVDHTEPGISELFVATQRALNYAYQNGTLVFASAGNEGVDFNHDSSIKSFPAELAHVISVSATAPEGWALDYGTNLDVPTSYTNYGSSGIDFAGPGGDSDFPTTQTCGANAFPCWVFDMVLAPMSEGWTFATGTSMAAPHAAGIAALIIEQNGGPMSPAHVLEAMRAGADDLGKPGQDDYFGYGRVNALQSLY